MTEKLLNGTLKPQDMKNSVGVIWVSDQVCFKQACSGTEQNENIALYVLHKMIKD